ncbi:MAG: glycosyltransferase [Dermatophilaceae bacterium]
MTALIESLTPTPTPSPSPDPTGPGGGRSAGTSAPPWVSAVLVVHDGATWLGDNLDALARQTLLPDRLVVVDVGSQDGSLELVREHAGIHRALADVEVRSTTAPVPYGTAIGLALQALGQPGQHAGAEWLWLLHDDTAADPTALERLVGAVRRSPSVGIAGPKVVQWDNPRLLVEAGHQLTRAGRRVSAPAVGEPDQGQYDTRTDVLAVGTAGMLVRRDVFESVGGFDRDFGQFGSDLDLGWRAQLAGHRVVVVPAARIREASAMYAGDRRGGPDAAAARRAQRQAARRVALTRCSPLLLPFLSVWLVVSALASALLLLLLKRPRHAWAELADLSALGHPVANVKARWRFRGKARLRRRDLQTLFVTTGEATRHTLDRVHDALTPEWARRVEPTPIGPVETGPVAEEAEELASLPASLAERVVKNPGVLAVLAATAVSLVGWRDALRDGVLDARGVGLSGGQLHSVATDSAGLWHAFRDSWHGAGWGSGSESGPYLAILAILTWLGERLPYVAQGRSSAAVTLSLVLLVGMPLATASAYISGRVLTLARWPRGLIALAWGASGVAAAAVAQGRVTVVLAHVLLPLVAAGMVKLSSRAGTFTAAFATALGAALLAAVVPLFGALVALVAALLLAVGPGIARRARALVVFVLPAALLGPSVLRLSDLPTLLSGPGLIDDGSTADIPLWQVALGQLSGASLSLSIGGAVVLLAGILGLARRASSRRRALALTGLAGLVLLGLAGAYAAPRVAVGDVQGVVATPWPGLGVQILGLALGAAALVGSAGRGSILRGPGWGPARLGGLVGVAVLAVAILAGSGLRAARGLTDELAVGQDALPAVAVDQARGALANRLLLLLPSPDRMDYELVGSEPGTLLRDLDRVDPVTDPGLAAIVSTLAGGIRDGGGTPGERLADLGVGFVAVRAEADNPIIRTLDATAGLTRLGSTEGQILWRVQSRGGSATEAVPPARVRVVDAAGTAVEAVATVGPHGAVDAALPVGGPGRLVVFAESPDWASRARVTFDGQALAPLPGGGTPAYALPPRAGQLQVDLPPVHARWFLAQLALVAFVVFMAIPFGNRRSRRPR